MQAARVRTAGLRSRQQRHPSRLLWCAARQACGLMPLSLTDVVPHRAALTLLPPSSSAASCCRRTRAGPPAQTGWEQRHCCAMGRMKENAHVLGIVAAKHGQVHLRRQGRSSSRWRQHCAATLCHGRNEAEKAADHSRSTASTGAMQWDLEQRRHLHPPADKPAYQPGRSTAG